MLGATGALIGFGAVMTREQVDMIEAWQAGRIDEAQGARPARPAARRRRLRAPVGDYRVRLKECLRILGVLETPTSAGRCMPLDDAERALLADVLAEVGLLSRQASAVTRAATRRRIDIDARPAS